MSSKSVTKTVAKKLQYYLDVKRREDGFDLSGPYLPSEDPNRLRAGPTLAYDGLHDRSLKHYYRDNNIKRHIQKMNSPPGQKSREKSVRNFIDDTMASVDYRLKPGPISPYAIPQIGSAKPKPVPRRPKALISVDEYMKTKRGSKRRKIPDQIVGKPRRLLRQAPPEHVSKHERERLVDMATKLIVATETVALPQTKKQSKGFQTSENDLPRLSRKNPPTAMESVSSGSESGEERYPTPPKSKPRSSHQRRPQSSFFKSSSTDSLGNKKVKSGVHVVLPVESSDSDEDRLRSVVGRMNLDGRGSSAIMSPRQKSTQKFRPKSAAQPLTSTAIGTDHVEFDYDSDDYDEEDSSRLSTSRSTNKTALVESPHEMRDTFTQTVMHSGTQTTKEYDDEEEESGVKVIFRRSVIRSNSDGGKEVYSPPVVATQASSTAEESTSTSLSSETQTRNRDLEPKVLTYEVYVLTGNKLGAGTKATVKLTMFGEYGDSGERLLLHSKTHRSKFQRDRVDVFVIDSVFLGKLSTIRIGHGETRLGYGWYLDKVFVKEGSEATRAFQFNCSRWFSSRDDDGQIVRDLPVTDVISASALSAELPRIDERPADDDFYNKASDSSDWSSEEEATPAKPDKKERTNKSKFKSSGEKTQKKDKEETHRSLLVAANAEGVPNMSERDGELEEDRFFEPADESEGEVEGSDDEEKEDTARAIDHESEEENEGTNARRSGPSRTDARRSSPPRTDNEEEEEEEEVDGGEEDTDTETETETEGDGEGERGEGGKEKVEENGEEEKEEEEPRVEFTQNDNKQDDQGERPMSARSDDYADGFKAGVKAKHEQERKMHKQSITDSENVLKKGKSIHDAARTGDLERIKELIDVAPAMKNTADERGMTPLHLAASNGRINCVKWLAVGGVDLSQETPTGYSAMHLSAMNGHVNCMMILSAMGAGLSCRSIDGLTPLHLACMSGFLECVKWLISNRANTEVEDNNGRTPLDIAEDYGHEEIVALLGNFKKELTRQDSTLSHLMNSEKRRKSMDSQGTASDADAAPSKVSDSGVGDENWISDTEEDNSVESLKNVRPDSASRQRPGSARDRPSSASRARTDSINTVEDKKKVFEKQKIMMKKRNSSFLDSIRMEVEENEEEF